MAAKVEAVGVPAKSADILIGPGDGAADLVGQHQQAPAGILHPGKVGHDIMRSGSEEHLGRTGEILRASAPPGAAMDEDEDWCGVASGAVDVEPFDLGRSVGDPLGLPGAPARQLAVADAALDQLL